MLLVYSFKSHVDIVALITIDRISQQSYMNSIGNHFLQFIVVPDTEKVQSGYDYIFSIQIINL